MAKEMLSGAERARYVNSLFARIAEHYDLMNRLMTGGQDRRWRQFAIRKLVVQPGERVLDLGSGTGDLARETLRVIPSARVAAADFTWQMMAVGKAQKGVLPFVTADALQTPFADECFDGIVSGYLMRNVGDLEGAMREQLRVLKPGGRLVILETTQPRRNLLTPFIWLHMHVVIPLLGGWLSGVREAYQYLPNSTEKFLTAEELVERLRSAGWVDIGFQRFMFGTMACHWARKP
jgi:demethylmenaquinone methyltransferase/2-methoxy-6-polyprenyl-1,4-benzoquinol methylase